MSQSLTKVMIRGFQFLLNLYLRSMAVKDYSATRPWQFKIDLRLDHFCTLKGDLRLAMGMAVKY